MAILFRNFLELWQLENPIKTQTHVFSQLKKKSSQKKKKRH
jgi:hypothetical protein